MRKIGLILIITLFISLEIPHDEIYELEDIAIIAKDNQLTPEEWVVTLKEKISKERAQEYLTTFKKNSVVKYTEYKHVLKYVIHKEHKDNDIDIIYEITIPLDEKYTPEIVVVMKGTNLSTETLKEYKNTLKYVRNQFFTNKYMLFTCLMASKNGKIASDDFSRNVSKKLDLMYVSTESDVINGVSYQETMYGYTKKWNNEIFIENKPLNIQLVIQRHKDEKQKVIIGTPLLITEY